MLPPTKSPACRAWPPTLVEFFWPNEPLLEFVPENVLCPAVIVPVVVRLLENMLPDDEDEPPLWPQVTLGRHAKATTITTHVHRMLGPPTTSLSNDPNGAGSSPIDPAEAEAESVMSGLLRTPNTTNRY